MLQRVVMQEGRRERDRQREREKEILICCSTYLCIHWLILVCAPTRDRTHNRGVLGRNSNQMSYPARAKAYYLVIRIGLICWSPEEIPVMGMMTRQLLCLLLSYFLMWRIIVTPSSCLVLTFKRTKDTHQDTLLFHLHKKSVATFTHGREAVDSTHPSNIY